MTPSWLTPGVRLQMDDVLWYKIVSVQNYSILRGFGLVFQRTSLSPEQYCYCYFCHFHDIQITQTHLNDSLFYDYIPKKNPLVHVVLASESRHNTPIFSTFIRESSQFPLTRKIQVPWYYYWCLFLRGLSKRPPSNGPQKTQFLHQKQQTQSVWYVK